jgi:hypothetical protein
MDDAAGAKTRSVAVAATEAESTDSTVSSAVGLSAVSVNSSAGTEGRRTLPGAAEAEGMLKMRSLRTSEDEGRARSVAAESREVGEGRSRVEEESAS